MHRAIPHCHSPPMGPQPGAPPAKRIWSPVAAIYPENVVLPQSRLLASTAPADSARSFAQATCGWMRPPMPQSVPATTFSLPTASAYRTLLAKARSAPRWKHGPSGPRKAELPKGL